MGEKGVIKSRFWGDVLFGWPLKVNTYFPKAITGNPLNYPTTVNLIGNCLLTWKRFWHNSTTPEIDDSLFQKQFWRIHLQIWSMGAGLFQKYESTSNYLTRGNRTLNVSKTLQIWIFTIIIGLSIQMIRIAILHIVYHHQLHVIFI